jgi:hypothetical protein
MPVDDVLFLRGRVVMLCYHCAPRTSWGQCFRREVGVGVVFYLNLVRFLIMIVTMRVEEPHA